jgi:hypothetical protein
MNRNRLFIGFFISAIIAAAACGKDPVGVKPNPQVLHDPEIFFHFGPNNAPAVGLDTVVMQWYRGTGEIADSLLLAEVTLGGGDSVCAFFLVPNLTQMYVRLVWKRPDIVPPPSAGYGLDTTSSTFWEVETTLVGNTSFGVSANDRNTASYCPVGMARDSIAAAP